jgi:hypothetical protein
MTSLNKLRRHKFNHSDQQQKQINNNVAINRGSLYPGIVNCALYSKVFLMFQERIQMENVFSRVGLPLIVMSRCS